MGSVPFNFVELLNSGQPTKQVESLSHFLCEEEDFRDEANHFYIPSDCRRYAHHFMTNTRLSQVGKRWECAIQIIHFAGNGKGPMEIRSHMLTFRYNKGNPEDKSSTELIYDDAGYFGILKRGDWTQVKSPRYPTSERGRLDAWNRALSAVGNKDLPAYNAIGNNCEHFVTGILQNGAGYSQQVINVIRSASEISRSRFSSS